MRREYFGTGDFVRSMFGFAIKKKVAAFEQEYRTAPLERRREIASQMRTLCAQAKKPDAALRLLEVMLRDSDPKAGPAARSALPELRTMASRVTGKSRAYVLDTIRVIEKSSN